MANVTIEIDAVDRTQALGNIANIVTGINSAVAIGNQIWGIAEKAYEATAGAAQKYDQQVKELMASTGGGAEATSRLIQVVDDMGISYQTLETAMKFAAKNGIDPSIESLARLSDQYLKLAPGVERGQFLMDTFGKSGLDMARAMELGGAAILAMNGQVEKNLVLTQKQIDASEQFRRNTDNLTDSWTGLKVVVGNEVIPELNTLMNQFTALTDSIQENGYWYTVFHQNSIKAAADARENQAAIAVSRDTINAHADALNADASAMGGLGDATAMTTDELNAMTKANTAQMSFVMKLQGVMTDYNKTLDETTKKYGAQSAEVAALEAQHAQSMRAIAYDLYVAKLQADGFTDAEFRSALSAGVMLGVIDSATAQMALGMDKAAQSAADASSEITGVKSAVDKLNGSTANVTITTTYVTIGTPTTETPGMCFLSGTLITLANKDKRRIEDIRIGDLLTSYDVENNRFVSSRVSSVMSRDAESYLIIDGIRVTSEHPFWCRGEWKKAGTLKVGDKLFGEDGREVEIENIIKVSGPVMVYNIEVDSEVHNYFADGILVHNKNTNRMLAEPTNGIGALPSGTGSTSIDYPIFVQALTEAIQRVTAR